jgi:hypothetical protein
MTDPFAGKHEITAAEWLAVVGRTEDALYVATMPQDAPDGSLMSPTPSQPKQRATATTARLRGIRESAFRDAVIEYAQRRGWKVMWTWHSKHSPAGWPDLFMVRASHAVAAELKIWPNKPTSAQLEWLAALEGIRGAVVKVYVWYPDDWAEIEEVLA